MKVLVTGICGFVGNRLAHRLKATVEGLRLDGLDNLSRAGSELNRAGARRLCETFLHGDLRSPADLEAFGDVDWVLDCAALPSVLAGTRGHGSPRQLLESNLTGTLNLLEFCRTRSAGLVLLSTSRVYAIRPLSALPLKTVGSRYELDDSDDLPPGVTSEGISEAFSTAPPVSLYGATKLAAETMALEYGHAYNLPVRVNRCGVIAGGGQFGRADQGIFSFWVHAHLARRPLRYLGCGGSGHQVRDCVHPQDVADLVRSQLRAGSDPSKPGIINVSGGREHSSSLRELTAWCDQRFGPHAVAASNEARPYDLPWIVLDHRLARQHWDWQPKVSTISILEEIAEFALANPGWLEVSS